MMRCQRHRRAEALGVDASSVAAFSAARSIHGAAATARAIGRRLRQRTVEASGRG